jgi:hypothetical protein
MGVLARQRAVPRRHGSDDGRTREHGGARAAAPRGVQIGTATKEPRGERAYLSPGEAPCVPVASRPRRRRGTDAPEIWNLSPGLPNRVSKGNGCCRLHRDELRNATRGEINGCVLQPGPSGRLSSGDRSAAPFGGERGAPRHSALELAAKLGDPWLNGIDVTGRADWLDPEEPPSHCPDGLGPDGLAARRFARGEAAMPSSTHSSPRSKASCDDGW